MASTKAIHLAISVFIRYSYCMPDLSIGALAKVCGIPANTLRTWERRYGFPCPRRTEGGQRVYDSSDLERLGLIAQALSQGHRAGQVVRADPDALRALLTPPEKTRTSGGWLEHVKALDPAALDQAIRISASQLGVFSFISEHVSPFLQEVGDAWEVGEIGVHEEHFASERLRVFLEDLWMPFATGSGGPHVVLATLPGEQHVLGLHMAAAVVATRGCPIIFLGADVPLEALAKSVLDSRADALLISVSTEGSESAPALLRDLRSLIPSTVAILCGGSGAPRSVPGTHYFSGLEPLAHWASLEHGRKPEQQSGR
jgi:hypothetical protein